VVLIGEKNGSKRHLLVDARGVPLSICVTGANRNDVTQLETLLDTAKCVPENLSLLGAEGSFPSLTARAPETAKR